MGITDLFSRAGRRGELLKQLQDEDSAVTKLNDRKMTANERLLNRMRENDRQEAIKKELARRTKREENEYWKKDVISQPNLFNSSNGNSLLKQGNLFTLEAHQ